MALCYNLPAGALPCKLRLFSSPSSHSRKFWHRAVRLQVRGRIPKESVEIPKESVENPKESVDLELKDVSRLIFNPFTEVQPHLARISSSKNESLARQRFSPSCEAAINEQINVEYNVSYVYHSLFAYFDRDNVALPGFANYFRQASVEEREHAETFMKYQNVRGGRVKLQSIMEPEMEFDQQPEKGDALHAMELALSLEKLTNEKLLKLTKVAEENGDPQMQDFVKNKFLAEQIGTNFSDFCRCL